MRYVTPLTKTIPRLTERGIVSHHKSLLYRAGPNKVSAEDFSMADACAEEDPLFIVKTAYEMAPAPVRL